MPRILVLDDSLARQRVFRRALIGAITTHAHSYYECVTALRENPPFDVIFLDHDLSDEAAAGQASTRVEKTGTDVVEFIVAMDPTLRPKKAVIHSLNPVGRSRMRQILEQIHVPVVILPFRHD